MTNPGSFRIRVAHKHTRTHSSPRGAPCARAQPASSQPTAASPHAAVAMARAGPALRWAWRSLGWCVCGVLACWAMARLRAGPSSGRHRPMLIRTIRFRLISRFRNSFPIRTIFNISDSGINFRFEQIFNISVSGIIFRFR